MATQIGVFLLIIGLSLSLHDSGPTQLIVWNVGQGQWVTLKQTNECLHFDMGGEYAPWKAIMNACRRLPNRISFSHWDWDHIGFSPKLNRFLPQSCVLRPPSGKSNSKKKLMLARLPSCREMNQPFLEWSPTKAHSANSASRVFLWRDVLIPGDSDKGQEAIWQSQLPKTTFTRVLILGHHGSRTSTSKRLLLKLPNLKMAIASARQSRYGHPHPEVIQKLEEQKIPLLSTEHWGNIHLYY